MDALKGPYDPQSPLRLIWDVIAIFLVTYDAFMIPTELAWGFSARDYYYSNLIFIFALSYWVCD